MTTDLFGEPLGGYPGFKLNLQQKRQATLLYHWMSLDYLRDLKTSIDALIKGADVNLELAKLQGRDALLTNERWGVRNTAANWSTFVFPALEDFRKGTISDIAARVSEDYGMTGANQCAHMIEEFSSMWMTEEEEARFKEQFKKVYHQAQFIDFAAGVGGRRNQLSDSSMTVYWQEFAHLFPKLPKFKVRTDIEVVTDKRPVRTGVYIAQDDPYATLQFAWTGSAGGALGALGALGDAETLNDIGHRIMSIIGRDAMWVDGQKMADYATAAFQRGELTDRGGFDAGSESDPRFVGDLLSQISETTRPCKWYFVERVEGEFDDEDTDQKASVGNQIVPTLRCEAGHPCPRSGYWFTPVRQNSRRSFRQTEAMPDVGGDYGTAIWQWDDNQKP